jgi:hypothetical protein
MTKLTARTPFSAQTDKSDLFHIVDVSDTSQDPQGSSYRVQHRQFATQTFGNATDRSNALPGFIGQLGVQLDTGELYRAISPSAGGWVQYFLYKKYVAIIGQNGTANPIVTVIENTIGPIVWTRVSAGIYDGTLSGAFSNNTICLSNGTVDGAFIIAKYGSNSIRILSTDTGFTLSDNVLAGQSIEIRVY